MMNSLPSRFIALTVIAFVILVTVGCRAPASASNDQKPFTHEGQGPTLFLQRGDYPEKLGVAMQKVLAEHGFGLPWIAVRGPDSSKWFVAERFKSVREFQRLCVHITSEEMVTANITAYRFGPSDWAILGGLFADFDPEAKTIATEITRKLRE